MKKETELFIKAYRINLPDPSEYTETGFIAEILNILKIDTHEINNTLFNDHVMIQIKGPNPKAGYASDIIESMLSKRVTIYHLAPVFF